MFAVAWFRDKPNITRHGKAFGISQATAYRYLDETIEVLAAQAPGLHQALQQAATDGLSHLILDGKIFEADRCRIKTISLNGETIDAWYSGKTHDFGANIQALAEPGGLPIWVGEAEPGGVVDIEAARRQVFPTAYSFARTLPILADPGYQGAGHGIHVPFKQPQAGRPLAVDNRTYNALLRALRCQGERGFSLLTERWTALKHTTLSPSRIGDLAKAALVLTLFEHRKIA